MIRKSGRLHAKGLQTIFRAKTGEIVQKELSKSHSKHVNVIPLIVDSIIWKIKEQLSKGVSVRLRGLGCLAVINKKAREGARNPKTLEPLSVKEHTTVKLRKSRISPDAPEFSMQNMIETLTASYPEVPDKTLRKIYYSFVEVINSCKDGKSRIEYRELGTFTPSYIPAQNKRNPKTGDTVFIEEHHSLLFSCSKVLHKELNKQK